MPTIGETAVSDRPALQSSSRQGNAQERRGPYMRLRTLQPSEVPFHPIIAELQQSKNTYPPALIPFLTAVLSEAISFIDDELPQSFKTKSANKQSPPCFAPVELLTNQPSASGASEAWFARRSVHVSERKRGTADYPEFVKGLLDDHSQHEMEYTPDVFDALKVLDWDEAIAKQTGETRTLDGFENVRMAVYEMCHHIPFPLYNRTFAVVVIMAATPKTYPNSFIVVQVPVDISKLPAAMYSNGRNRQEGDSARKRKKVVLGEYVSVERVKAMKHGEDKITWEMATASDAKGWLPMWAQKMGVPGAVVKDVGLFMDWTAKRRA
ncbi:hypothetical protein LTR66_005002 [Elasticomyces elasticus]|nr:hypothetical protein LTR50_004532 [Elasticomyces elasticus]KAK4995123.1 hypothetical protein LTR66_005002 [Elasticomyces elasticus]